MSFAGLTPAGNQNSGTENSLEYAASMILQVFQRFDKDGGGTLERRELRRLLRECGAKLSSHQIDDIIDQLDTDGDGEMNFAEFMSFLGRLYQLQFYGTDPGQFWNRQARPSPAQHQHQQPYNHNPSGKTAPPNRPLPVPPPGPVVPPRSRPGGSPTVHPRPGYNPHNRP